MFVFLFLIFAHTLEETIFIHWFIKKRHNLIIISFSQFAV